ncbi:acyl-ACP--UDP-N- acetylglucosamine O-acyltransferase [Rhodococcoides yunnanense]|uniref:acyl-ACP--UDP-N- acetylglucosamine O-acyltransferase n=1 Tax=Rhodococcoides yunnanense TaxID=278209 RepID=UPI0009332B0E|nr:acyl-ACP--UDP-N- acetylglucosamine O-acyltransferase [Rhodococcus yunnanensis]
MPDTYSSGQHCTVHPSAVIGPHVTLGDNVTVGPFAVITGSTEVGDDCWIGPHTVIGTPPEILGVEHFREYDTPGGEFGVSIGRGTTLREYTTVHAGSERTTTIGADCFIMNRTSVEHDCQLGDGTITAAGTVLAGHVSVGPGCNFGVGSAVHQRRVVGAGAMVGMGAVVTKDVPPFSTVVGNPAHLHGANSVGMGRKGYSEFDIQYVSAAYAAHELPAADGVSVDASAAFDWWKTLAQKPLLR